jgi:hypothetical protein
MFKMLALVFKVCKSRSKIIHFIYKIQGYPHFDYLLAISLHQINIFIPVINISCTFAQLIYKI